MDTPYHALNTTRLGLPLGATVRGRDFTGMQILPTPMSETLNFGFAPPVPTLQLGVAITCLLEEDLAFANCSSPTGATMLGLVATLFHLKTLQPLVGMETH